MDRIPNEDVIRIVNTIKELSVSPIHVKSKKLSGNLGLYRVRQGNYRIIYSINNQDKEIRIIVIGHRKEVYR